MKVRLILVGRTARGFVSDGVAHYLDRVRRERPVEEVVVPEAGKGDPAHQARTEGQRILAALGPGERVVALDERGVALPSQEFAAQIGRWRDQGVRQVAFIVGGAFGLSDDVRSRADLVLSLSSMTFPHQLVRLLFAEQLYRAFTILRGSPYHH
ncbi:MAG: 23S rRNA (pseudouridine(1915)-N(3))-methyltransferase RlmH [Flavobacteriales bacterium]|nr:23S rRNA (pseudouridine(1915)-N(3))-methyltransferase RlmH [Flavobacteriales bacterium]